jgi:hypothetical protein
MTATTRAATDEYARDPVWGPMSHPATDAIEDGRPPWKDHVYLAFWDQRADVYGFFHWNSSPNHDTGKAQLSAWFKGQPIDIKERLRPSSTRFRSEHFDFDLKSEIEVLGERLHGRVVVRPRFSAADYTPGGLLPPLVPGEPLEHWQQGLTLRGELTFDGQRLALDALGFRTRTWGFRDDSNQFQEYVSLFICLESCDITAMKFRWPDGSLKTDGFVVSDQQHARISDMSIWRDSAGQVTRLGLELDDGHSLTLERRGCAAGLWCPIGLPERLGPTFAAWDEVIDWELAGERGFSLVEQAIVRHVF